ncbi:DUF2213 domain-containing protein [uncultured Paraglaciecola sp.]|uniref:DUF2213 domain-containing protein n=1 Tax=uncultured Paraglaciecola sp. TaxID=1765024 RepID=UPI00262B1CC3|nr:DUF2213 domain-containing protein [uncultured Paraglaciecola sp.]
MKTVNFVEDAELSGVRETSDGYLVAEVRCARTGIQNYAGSEVGLMDQDVVRVYRPEAEVFSTDSLSTFSGKPVTNDHPPEMVTADNWKQYAVGDIGEDVLRDGQYIRVPIKVMDAAAIKQIKDGKRQVSMGYTNSLSIEQGTTPEGETYDAVMRDLKMNHLAIVQRGRAGSDVRIGDSWGAYPITKDEKPTMTTKTITVDGLTVETTDAGAKAIEKLQRDNQALQDAATTAQSSHDAALQEQKAASDEAIAAKDAELATKDAEIDKLKAEVLTDADLDKRVANRSALVSKATSIVKDAKFDGKTDLEIKTITVDSVRGDNFCKDKADAYIDAAFDLLEVKADKFRDVVKSQDKQTQDDDDNGQDAYEKRLTDAYKSTTGAAA